MILNLKKGRNYFFYKENKYGENRIYWCCYCCGSLYYYFVGCVMFMGYSLLLVYVLDWYYIVFCGNYDGFCIFSKKKIWEREVIFFFGFLCLL